MMKIFRYQLLISICFITFTQLAESEDFVKVNKEEYIRDGDYLNGFKLNIENVSKGRNIIINFYIVVIIYKYVEGKRIYIDYQQHWWDSLNIYPNYYNSLTFNFRNPYNYHDPNKEFYFDTSWYYTSASY